MLVKFPDEAGWGVGGEGVIQGLFTIRHANEHTTGCLTILNTFPNYTPYPYCKL